MNYGRKLFHIMAAACGMFIAITGLAFKTGYFQVDHPDSGYVLLVIGAVITIYYLAKIKSD